MALVNNFGNSLSALTLALAPTPALAPSLSSPRYVILTLIGLVSSFQPGSTGLAVLALAPAPAPAPTPASPLLAKRLHNLMETF
ncbi:hypothetical protein B7463_g11733, partial [Scytalidium lignicola]